MPFTNVNTPASSNILTWHANKSLLVVLLLVGAVTRIVVGVYIYMITSSLKILLVLKITVTLTTSSPTTSSRSD